MTRIPFSEVLKNASIDIGREYDRLYAMFYGKDIEQDCDENYSLRDICEDNFIKYPFRGTCVTLDDFDDFYGYHFVKEPSNFDLNYLVSFCEYSYNMILYCNDFSFGISMMNMEHPKHLYMEQIRKVIEKIGYMEYQKDGITDYVPKDQAAIAVAEIVEPSLSFRVIEYNHHSMKGDLDKKKKIIRDLADKLEPERKRLGNYNKELSDNIFYLVNKLNIRHNNIAEGTPNYYPTVANMDDDELETWYDEIYQMLLLAFLELEHIERKEKIKGLKERIENKK